MLRRTFLKTGTSAFLLGASSLPLIAMEEPEMTKLTILHTNDVHSRIDPFPMDGGKYSGMGGVAKRAEIINNIRKKEKNVLLLDAGDIFQGTYYFNIFKGEPEIKLMSKLGYDAGTLGNHDFDNGIDGFVKQFPHANFPFINCNYEVSNTDLKNKLKDYVVIKKDKLRIGITAIGIDLDGLVPKDNYEGLRYFNPIEKVNKIAKVLKYDEKCDFVICLSHLGYKYDFDKISDKIIAQESEDIDLIIGGHTHTFMEEVDFVKNKKDKPVMINQVGFAGIYLGRIDVVFEHSKNNKCITCKPINIK